MSRCSRVKLCRGCRTGQGHAILYGSRWTTDSQHWFLRAAGRAAAWPRSGGAVCSSPIGRAQEWSPSSPGPSLHSLPSSPANLCSHPLCRADEPALATKYRFYRVTVEKIKLISFSFFSTELTFCFPSLRQAMKKKTNKLLMYCTFACLLL